MHCADLGIITTFIRPEHDSVASLVVKIVLQNKDTNNILKLIVSS